MTFAAFSYFSCVEKKESKKEIIGEFASSEQTLKNGNVTTIISSDTSKLNGILNFKNFTPYSVKFQYSYIDNSGEENRTIPGPSDFNLEAVLYFDSVTFSRLMDAYNSSDSVSSNYDKNEFNFNWLDSITRNELFNSNTIPKVYIDLFWSIPNDRNCHIWMLNKKLLLHRFSN